MTPEEKQKQEEKQKEKLEAEWDRRQHKTTGWTKEEIYSFWTKLFKIVLYGVLFVACIFVLMVIWAILT